MRKGPKGELQRKKIRTVGPWGGSRGNDFDDGTFSDVKEIKIGCDRWIHSVNVIYDEDGNSTDPYIDGAENADQSAQSEVKFADIC